jgi:uncharacterized protein (TIGR00156 family)
MTPLPRRAILAAALACALPAVALAQFTGPSAAGVEMTVAEALETRPGTYATLAGTITTHLGEEYYRFEDDTGSIRVEIRDGLWRGRRVGPEDRVRLSGEVDRSLAGGRYLWVTGLEVVAP